MNRTTRIVFWSVGGLALVAAVFFTVMTVMLAKGLSGSWPWERRTAIEYRIPKGYQGWVRLNWGVKGTPPLAKSGRYLIVTFDSDGGALTSSAPQSGWAADKYFYVSPAGRQNLPETGWCKGGMIWGDSLNFETPPRTADGKTSYIAKTDNPVGKFFVGTEDQYRQTVDPLGKILSPCR